MKGTVSSFAFSLSFYICATKWPRNTQCTISKNKQSKQTHTAHKSFVPNKKKLIFTYLGKLDNMYTLCNRRKNRQIKENRPTWGNNLPNSLTPGNVHHCKSCGKMKHSPTLFHTFSHIHTHTHHRKWHAIETLVKYVFSLHWEGHSLW